jgi:hypothetical protein
MISMSKHVLQVVKMFVLVIAIFGICWLPYHVYFIYSFHDQSIVRYDEHNSPADMLLC